MSAVSPDPATHALSGAPARFPGGLREIAPRTWAWLQPNGGLGESNAGLVVGDGASLLIDALWDERLTRRMLDAMAPMLADAPLRRAFITHPDGDHWWGNAILPPELEIVATAACDRAMRREALPRVLDGMTRVAALARHVPGKAGAVARYGHAQLAPFAWRGVRLRDADQVLAWTTDADRAGGPRSADADSADRAGGGEDAHAPGEDPGCAPGWVGPGLSGPARSSVGATTLDVGGREARILDLGPTHSPADAVVHLLDVGVVFAADLLFIGVTPIMWHGPVETWLSALDALLALDAGVYVPGHGPPCGRAEIEQLAEYWRWLRDGVREQRTAGRSPGDAARELLRSPEHARWSSWLNPERIIVSVATAYRNPDGASAELSPPARARLLVQMWALGAELAASAQP